MQYQCDDGTDPFAVEYINAAPNFLAVIPVGPDRQKLAVRHRAGRIGRQVRLGPVRMVDQGQRGDLHRPDHDRPSRRSPAPKSARRPDVEHARRFLPACPHRHGHGRRPRHHPPADGRRRADPAPQARQALARSTCSGPSRSCSSSSSSGGGSSSSTRCSDWTFGVFAFLIGYAVTLFLLAALLFPDKLDDYDGYEDFFLKRRHWFFGVFAATFVLDIIDTLIKGAPYFDNIGIAYLVQVPIGIALCLVAIWTADRRYPPRLGRAPPRLPGLSGSSNSSPSTSDRIRSRRVGKPCETGSCLNDCRPCARFPICLPGMAAHLGPRGPAARRAARPPPRHRRWSTATGAGRFPAAGDARGRQRARSSTTAGWSRSSPARRSSTRSAAATATT